MKQHISIIKIGTQVLTTPDGQLNLNLLRALTYDVARYIKDSRSPVIIVSSGAVTSGAEFLNITPQCIPEEQAAAAVGQILLMQEYSHFFKSNGHKIAQILLTRDAFDDPQKALNTKNTLLTLLDNDIIPIINENDTVSTEEIKFGDNDQLSSLTAILIGAKQLLMLTDTDGVFTADPNVHSDAELIEVIPDIQSFDIDQFASGPMSKKSRGGMKSKLNAAKLASAHGTQVIIANGKRPDVVFNGLQGKTVGTLIHGG